MWKRAGAGSTLDRMTKAFHGLKLFGAVGEIGPAWHWPAALLSCLVVALVGNAVLLFHDQLIPGVDLYTHYRWALQFHQALAEGVLYPRWIAAASYGLGEPAFVYYPPAYFYLVSLVQGVTGDLWTSMKVVATSASFFAGLVAYAITRRAVGVGWALLAAVLVQTMPFLLFMQGYLNTFPWHASVPLILLVVYGTLTPSKNLLNWRLSVALALLAMTHILAALMVLLCLPWAFLTLERSGPGEGRWRALAGWGFSVTVGLFLAMLYLLPALTTWDLINPEAWNYSKTVDWRTAFAFPVITSRVWGVRWFGPQWILASSVLVLAAVATAAAYRLHRHRIALPHGLATLLCIAWAALILASEISYPLYTVLGPLRKVQYPYRFLCVAAPAATIAGVLALWGVVRQEQRLGWRVVFALPLIGSAALFGFLQMAIFSQGSHPLLSPKLLRAHFGAPEYYTASRKPGWVAYVNSGGMHGACTRAGGSGSVLVDRTHEKRWLVVARSDMTLPLPVFAYPAWSISVDGQPRPSATDPTTGLLAVRLPAGEHTIRVVWSGLPEERAGLTIVLLTAAFIAGVFLRRGVTRARIGGAAKSTEAAREA